jgi:methyl-accepting chemotaxis protein
MDFRHTNEGGHMSKLRIGTRLYLGFGAIVAVLVILVAMAYANFSRLAQANAMNVHTYEVMAQSAGMLESLVNIETGSRGFALTGKEASLEPLNAGLKHLREHLDRARALTADNPNQQERLRSIETAAKEWQAAAVDPLLALRRAATAGSGSIEAMLAFEQAGKGKQGMDAMRAQLAQFEDAERSLLGQRAAEAESLQRLTANTLFGGGVVAAVLAGLIAVWLARNITGPLRSAVALAQRVAQGDLTSRIEVNSQDETGELLQALKDMNEALVRIVSQVRSGTDTIATASAQIAAGNMDLSSRTEQQASSLEETASSLEEMTSTVNQNADHARQADTMAISASDVAQRGGAVVSEVVSTMGSINESARKIVDIIGVIDGIAFQTNILALNAAVEAARAGEQGRGFAVVASEVRNLAQRSASAAKEIKALIDNSVQQVEIGSRLVDRAGSTMGEVVDSVQRVSAVISEITGASEQQRQGIDQVNEAITQIDHVTQQNAALVEQAAAAAKTMQEQAAELSNAVAVFRIDDAPRVARAQPVQARPVSAPRHPARAPARVTAAPPARQVVNSESWEEF